VVPQSIMPKYSFLAETDLAVSDISANLTALSRVGVPYTDTDIASAESDMMAQANPDLDAGDLEQRYPKAQVRDYDGNPDRVTEMDALIAYLQMLGTLVDVESAAAQAELAGEEGR
jgi:cytochrome c oxidase cbb3-type subunit 2